MKPIVLAMDSHSARLAFPCGDPMCQEPDCAHVVMIREPGDPEIELAPFWRSCVVLGPHGDNLREHDKQDLMHRAMEEMDAREERETLDRVLDRLWSAELDRYCHRCDEPLHKCSCAELEELIDERWAGAS